MPSAHEFKRAEGEFDPKRCIAIGGSSGQCMMQALPGFKYCIIHGRSAIAAKNKADIRMYQLGKYQAQFEQFKTDPEVKSLRAEIGMCRTLMQEIWKGCSDPNDLAIAHNRIMDVAKTLEKLISSCDRIEARNNTLLDRENIITICNVMINVTKRHVTSPAILEMISNDLIQGIADVSSIIIPGEPTKEPPVDQATLSELAAGFDESECDDAEPMG